MTDSFLQIFPHPFVIISMKNNDAVLVYQNDFFQHIFNRNNAESFLEIFPDEKDALFDAIKKGQAFTLEINPKPDLWLKLTGRETFWKGESAWIVSVDDISDMRAEQDRLQHVATKADHASEMKSNFLATMSHEIRTPMQSIYGTLELLRETITDSDAIKLLGTAKNSASGLLEILDDILDLAKVDAGKMELDHFEIPLRTLARGLLEGLEFKARAQNIRLVDKIDEDIPFVVMGDPKRLRQVILNLVGNSIKFTKEGSVKLRIQKGGKALKDPDNGFILRFEIIDTGIGMSDDVAGRLFSPFTQADNSTTREFGGTGLGLSISKKLVELMGGKIGVESELGKGSTFWFEFPTQKASEDNMVQLPDLEGLTVLSIEDHPKGAQEIVNSLRSMGAEVHSTADYEEALKWIAQRPFDVGIFDYGIPGEKNGLDILKEAAKLRPFMGLIMYTVHDDLQIQYDLKTLGATYLSKPASRLGLGQAVKDAAKQTHKIDFDGPHKLLVAEDTVSVRDILSRQFKLLGVEADFVENGKQALEKIKTGDYGLLITDLHMPELDGYALTRKLRDEEELKGKDHLPIIAMTADVQLAHRQSYIVHGFDECLLKPVSMGQLKRLFIRWGLLSEDNNDNESQPREEAAQTQQTSTINTVDEAHDETPAIIDEGDLPPAVDKDAMVHQMGAFDENAIEMLHMFVDMTKPLMEGLNQAYNDNNRPKIKEIAHSLKGSARSACCPHLGNLCEELQTLMERGSAPDRVLHTRILNEFNRVEKAVNEL